MRAAPPFQVCVERLGVWRAAVIALLTVSAAVAVAWLIARHASMPFGWQVAIGGVSVLLLAGGAGLFRISPFCLRWDGQAWHLGPAASAGDEPCRGSLAVALDLGAWMLLRFDHESAMRGRRTRWLPVQRRGLEGRWHALRCAVYCSRPVSGIDAGHEPGDRPRLQE
jgi:hypothetical protein